VQTDALQDIRRRAAAREPEALAFSAVLAGLGAGEPHDWAEAVARLRRAADAGLASAADQLRVLAGLEGESRLDAWLHAAPRERLLNDPRIAVSRGFLPPAACDWLIARARGRVAQAQVFDAETGAGRVEETRSNSAWELKLEDLDLVLVAVRARIAATVSTPAGALEPIQVLHYAMGQRFERHFDFLDPAVPGYAADIARRGQRMATFLVYLNEGFGGGETDFPIVGLSHKGGAGDALMFANLDAQGRPDRRTLHAGLPPTSGEKWLLSQWIRDRA